jgi:ArsR family transcriptional regulator
MTQPALLKHMATMSDVTRCRVLRLLARQELTVSELCSVLQLPQSTVSRHLKALLDDDWITSRRDGTSRFYGMTAADLEPDARSLWGLIQEQVGESAVAVQDDARVDGVLASRRSKAREFFSSAAGEWDHLRDDLFGRSFHLHALLGLLDHRWTVGDLGCGTGLVTATVAPFVERVIAVDGSNEMLATACERLGATDNVDVRQGELEALPVPDGTLDAALLVLVLHYVPDVARVLGEVARVLKPGGKLLIVDMLPHEREEFQQQMGHVWLGFSEPQLQRFLSHAGLSCSRYQALPTDPEVKGPALFAATATRGGGSDN